MNAPDEPKPLRRTMSLVTETLARAAMTGTAFPPSAKCPDFPLANFFFVEKAPSDADLRATMKKIVAFDRLRSKVVQTKKGGKYAWSEVADVEDHLMKHVTREEVDGEGELRKLMDALLVKPLDTDRPLWDVTVITLKPVAKWAPGPGSPSRAPPVVCVRVSHAVGDGLALVNVLENICTGADGGGVKTLDFKRRKRVSAGKKSSMLNPITCISAFFAMMLYICQCVWAVLVSFGTPFGPHDSRTAFCARPTKVKYSGRRSLIVCPSFGLDEIKQVKTTMGCTVNDVVCACLAGAITLYNHHRRNDVKEKREPLIRAAVPYSFPDRPKGVLTNAWTFVSLKFTTGRMEIVKRLKKTQHTCDLMKKTPGAWATKSLNIISAKLLGAKFQSNTIYDFMSRHSMVFTNVPGPIAPVRIFGSEMKELVFGVGNLVNQVSVVSYAGSVGLSLVVDEEEVKEAHLIGDFFQLELNNLKDAAAEIEAKAAEEKAKAAEERAKEAKTAANKS